MPIIEPGKPVPLWIYGAGTVVIGGGYFLYRNRKNKAAAAAAAATPKAAAAAPTASTTPVVPASSYGNNQNAGALANISQQLGALNAAQAATQGAAAASGVVDGIIATAQNQVMSGSGYYSKPDATGNRSQRINSNGHTYVWVPNDNAAKAAGGYNELFVQPVPGFFVKNAPGTPLTPMTPLFAQVN
jgi:hypothetical protein